eukprot:CAMPEP_0119349554 /NCGR_PEP_ID=MMETSP1333-20130426/109610_1 /TAXON_ID=418940 /ORGANISM="Scyphosphaera apsteinii, Strain RCC1455" /LENGTH=35 /DNA_ID= /DNA_START= /DNA_END= /DNA_ORIENTATION=
MPPSPPIAIVSLSVPPAPSIAIRLLSDEMMKPDEC